MLQSRALILWCPAEGEDRPYEGTHETVLFEISWSVDLLFLYLIFVMLFRDFGEFNCIILPCNLFCIFPSSHICVKLFLGSCHISISSNTSSILAQFLVPACLLSLAELSWCSVLRMRASTSSINLLARESSGRVTGSMLEILNLLYQNAPQELPKHKRVG